VIGTLIRLRQQAYPVKCCERQPPIRAAELTEHHPPCWNMAESPCEHILNRRHPTNEVKLLED
jgi:hypothetical protein